MECDSGESCEKTGAEGESEKRISQAKGQRRIHIDYGCVLFPITG